MDSISPIAARIAGQLSPAFGASINGFFAMVLRFTPMKSPKPECWKPTGSRRKTDRYSDHRLADRHGQGS